MSSWITIVLWFLITVLIFYIKQSGIPYKSPQHEQNVKYIGSLFLFWVFAFIVKAIVSYFSLQMSFDKTNDNDFTQLILVVISNFVTDIAPIISVLEVKFIDLFKIHEKSLRRTHDEHDDEDMPRLLPEDMQRSNNDRDAINQT